jgi:hypothetical protein
MHLLLTTWLALAGLVGAARAESPAAPEPAPTVGPAPDAAFKDLPKLPKDEKAAEAMSASEQEAERKRKERLARVIVLKWPDNRSVDYTDGTIQRTVKSRIARPEAQFFPEVDLYQNGRKVKDRTVVPAMQPATVPDQNLSRVRDAVARVSTLSWNAMQPDQWGIEAQQLREMVELIWFVDKVEQREPLFLLYAQIGKAAENQNAYVPPFYEQIGPVAVNYYWYLAATLAYQDPSLMSKLTDQDLNGNIAGILSQMQQGVYPKLKVDFEQEGEEFDLEKFGKEYEVYMSGLQTDPSPEGQLEVFLGRTDIYLKRKESGHGLSERLEVSKLEDKIYFVRDTARKKMGRDFIEQLFLNPNECTPSLDGEILTYLAIYAKIHEKADIFVAVPQYGNPNRVYVWRYDRPSANLSLVGGGADGFPVRFALSASVGAMYNAGPPTLVPDTSQSPDPSSTDPIGDLYKRNVDAGVELTPAAIPLNFELRAHYNRLMLALGAEFSWNSNGAEAPWAETYRTPGSPDAEVLSPDENDVDEDGDIQEKIVDYHDVVANRDLYLGASAVLGRDAGVGMGPRVGARIGWSNVPYALQTTAHVGMTIPAPGIKGGERVRPFIDVDGRAGLSWPFKESLAFDTDKSVTVLPMLGLTAGIGTTF